MIYRVLRGGWVIEQAWSFIMNHSESSQHQQPREKASTRYRTYHSPVGWLKEWTTVTHENCVVL